MMFARIFFPITWIFIAAIAVVMFGQHPAYALHKVALIIGNSNYPSAPLPNPANDAKVMGETLAGLGFKVFTYTDLDQNNMKRAIRNFGDVLLKDPQNTVGLFFYAGHGMQINGTNYLVPVGAQIRKEADVEIEGVPARDVLATMEYANTRMNMVILDACRNNPFARSFRSGTQGLARMDAPKGTLIAYSTSPGNVASDGRGANSPYTEALVSNMRTPGLAVEQMFKNVRIDVLNATKDAQTPWESSSLTGDFYFSGTAKPAAAPQIAARQSAELTFWDSIKNSTDPRQFQAYIKKYPNGQFIELAKLKASPPSQNMPQKNTKQTLQVRKTANARQMPTLQAPIIATIDQGQTLLVLGTSQNGLWYKVMLDDQRVAYIHSTLMTNAMNAFTTAPAPTGQQAIAPPQTPVPHQQAARPPAATKPRIVNKSLSGSWSGFYTCQNEKIGLTLDLKEQNKNLSGSFSFYPIDGGPSVMEGAYQINGKSTENGAFTLTKNTWIQQAWGMQRHNLRGKLSSDGRTLSGRITSMGCTRFVLVRD